MSSGIRLFSESLQHMRSIAGGEDPSNKRERDVSGDDSLAI
jgi:hypothetical protein